MTTELTRPGEAAGGNRAGTTAGTEPDVAVGVTAPAIGAVRVEKVRVATVTLTVEVADTPAAWARGLMGRTYLPAGTGMLFVFHGESTDGFYMYRTLLPLSLVFIRYGHVVAVREMTPCVENDPDRCEIYRAGTAYTEAVEAPAGTFTDAGTRPGDVIDFD
ncbi:DUF192 domain-containing protein [Frankia sp. Cppng1_Ct_nod]|uniref:DUF192 domain-containing protein n=1 Tax=Frankia sp. Cppng1_Ct_nod TaxID=2897162 RepID=UPI001F5F14D5|nr:DUF192 domain-containing protein [Frankia sp. Cppng1_Ct_nod]